jgi:hypothetical protein
LANNQLPSSTTTTLVTWLVGVFGGLSVLLYLAGIVAVTMRLVVLGLPFETPVADLPQSYFLTVALIEMAGPSLLLVGVYFLVREFIRSPARARLKNTLTKLTHRRWIVYGGIVGWAIILLNYWLLQRGNPLTSWPFWVGGALVAVGISLTCHELAAHAPSGNIGLRRATIASLVAIGTLPYVVAFNSTAPLDTVTICPALSGHSSLRLVGENGDRIWLVDRTANKRHLLWLPLNTLQSVWDGGDTSQISCPTSKASTPSSATPKSAPSP